MPVSTKVMRQSWDVVCQELDPSPSSDDRTKSFDMQSR